MGRATTDLQRRVDRELAADPKRTNRAIAAKLGCGEATVRRRRGRGAPPPAAAPAPVGAVAGGRPADAGAGPSRRGDRKKPLAAAAVAAMLENPSGPVLVQAHAAGTVYTAECRHPDGGPAYTVSVHDPAAPKHGQPVDALFDPAALSGADGTLGWAPDGAARAGGQAVPTVDDWNRAPGWDNGPARTCWAGEPPTLEAWVPAAEAVASAADLAAKAAEAMRCVHVPGPGEPCAGYFVASDGYRLVAAAPAPIAAPPGGALVGAAAVAHFTRAAAAGADPAAPVEVGIIADRDSSARTAVLRCGPVVVQTLLAGGDYPDVARVVPERTAEAAVFDDPRAAAAWLRSVAADGGLAVFELPAGGPPRLLARRPGGAADSIYDRPIGGADPPPAPTAAFNPGFLADALDAIPDGQAGGLRLAPPVGEHGGGRQIQPAVVAAQGREFAGGGTSTVLMPVRLAPAPA